MSSFMARAFSRCLKATVKRAALILAAWPSPGNRPGRRSFFLPPNLPSLLHHPPFPFSPLCLVLCIIKTSLPATWQPVTRPFWGQFPQGRSASPRGEDPRGQAPRVAALCDGMRFKLQLATFSTLRRGSHYCVHASTRARCTSAFPPPISSRTPVSPASAWSLPRGPMGTAL